MEHIFLTCNSNMKKYLIIIYTHILNVKSMSLLSLESNGANENSVSTMDPNVPPKVTIWIFSPAMTVSPKQISINVCQVAWRQIQCCCSLSTCSSNKVGIHFPNISASTTLSSQEIETKIEPNPICRKSYVFNMFWDDSGRIIEIIAYLVRNVLQEILI